MALLPENKPMTVDITPKVFFIWGQSMHGKTYLAKQFPNPIILNTDGNGKKIDTPHVEVQDFETFVNVLREIESGKHTYQTVVIDLIDDIKTFLEDYVCKKYNVENLADAGFGKGYADVKTIWKRLQIRLSKLPYYVVFISHIIQTTDEFNKETVIEQPSLEQKYLNMTKGRTDVMIKCQKVGKNYIQMCNEKRTTYLTTDISDKKLLETLKDVKNLFDDLKPSVKPLTPSGKPLIKPKNEPISVEPKEETPETTEAPNDDLLETTEVKPKKSLLIKNEEE